MRALVWHGPEQMTVEEVPKPDAEAGTVIVRSEACGICGSEIEGYLGRMGNRTPPLVMGHEFAGTIVETGQGTDPSLVGRKVAINPLVPCGECTLCRAGLTNVCPHRWLVGIQQPGGFAEYVRVPVANVAPLPDEAPPFIGALAEPLANGVHAVALGLQIVQADHVVVIGAGTIGLLAMQAARLFGISTVAVVEPYDARRRRARQYGAEVTYASGDEAREGVREETDGLGTDLVIEAVGADDTRRLAVDLLRPAGCVILLGLHEDLSTLPFHGLIRNQITLRGSFAYTQGDYTQALDWLVQGRAGIGAAGRIVPLAQGPEMFSELAKGPVNQVKTFLVPAGVGQDA